ncbi:MAG: tyrosine-protein kinase [Thermomicrobiales bacterium]|jgi:non-specific protein-tyrosine kinase|nr:tyrosine-protein kinase [Thermomicrobiales bacterium]
MEFDLRQLFRIARRRWWLLLLAPLIAGLTARYVDTRRQFDGPSLYAARAVMLVEPNAGNDPPSYSLFTFSHLAQSKSVLAKVVDDLRLPNGVTGLASRVTSAPVLDNLERPTELVEIEAQDEDPQRAADIANGIIRAVGEYLADQQAARGRATRETIYQQMADLDQQIAETQQQIRTLQQAPNAGAPDAQTELDLLNESLNRFRQAYLDLQAAAQQLDLSTTAAPSWVTLVDPADPPTETAATAGRSATIPAAFAGFVLAGALVLLLEFLDNTVKSGTNFPALTGAGLLSIIPRARNLRPGRGQLFVLDQPDAPAAEAIRRLRANLDFVSALGPVKSIAISSPGSGDGKTSVAANLAVAMAQAGIETVLIDANLRTPILHAVFAEPNNAGVTSLLVGGKASWHEVARPIAAVRHLTLITSGPVPVNPADLLSRDRLPALLAEIGAEADAILIDTPPVLAVSDALAVAAHVDGVILVCRSGRTRIDSLSQAVDALHHGVVRIIGTVLNLQTRHDEGYSSYRVRSERELPASVASPASTNSPRSAD